MYFASYSVSETVMGITEEHPITVIYNFLQFVIETFVRFCVGLEVYTRIKYNL
jgi:hypothetical protein